MQSIEADREASHATMRADLRNQQLLREQQRKDDELATLIALEAELRLNRRIAVKPIARSYPVPMERSALDRAKVLLSSLREENRESVEQAWTAIAFYNTIAVRARAASSLETLNQLHGEGQNQAKAAIEPLDAAIAAVHVEVLDRQGMIYRPEM